MKRVLFVTMCLFFVSFHVLAKKPNAMWYFLSQTSTSISEDDNIRVQYGIYTKYAVTEYDLGPYPTMRIKITNKSDKVVFIDLGTSYLKNNDLAAVIYTPTIRSAMIGRNVSGSVNVGSVANAVGIGGIVGSVLDGVNVGGSKGSSVTTTTYAQRFISIPPQSSVFLEDIQVFTENSQKAVGDYIYFKYVGKPKRLWCLSYKFRDIEVGGTINYTEDNPAFTIGCYLNYSFTEDFKENFHIETTYYTKMLVGSSFSTFPPGNSKEFNVMDKAFPEWRNEIGKGSLEVIRLWAH